MVHWRRLTATLAVASAGAVLAACGTGTSQDSGGGNGKVTLSLKAITDNRPSWQQAIADYKKVDPNVTINASYAPIDDLQTSLRAQLGGGNAPDMFVVWPGNGSAMAVQQLAPAGVLADLSGESWIDPIPASLKPLLGDKGKTYIWSPGVTPIGVIYNKGSSSRPASPTRRPPGTTCWPTHRRSRRQARSRSRSATRRRGSRS
jgi:raffinose/stachyose/melibiose transport system substrate-binding protein